MSNPERLNWDDVRYFLAVAETGSFSKAAEDLKADQTTVGRRVRELEERMGVKLFDRHRNGMRLTPSGLEIVDEAESMKRAASSIQRRLYSRDSALEGPVRISATEGLAAYWLIPRLVAFQQACANLTFEVVTEDAHSDLANREADIAIRLSRPRDPRLVGRRVGVMRFGLFADEEYLSIFGTPATRSELRDHRCIDLMAYQESRSLAEWHEITAGHPRIVMRTSTSTAYYKAVKSGYGFGLFPRYNRIITPELVPLMIPFEGSLEIWLVSHEETNKAARVREVLNRLSEMFERDRAEWFS